MKITEDSMVDQSRGDKNMGKGADRAMEYCGEAELM